jgi:surface polysaccharide O-acyltransferase-like enzyme
VRTEISCMRVVAAFAVVLIHVSGVAVGKTDPGLWIPGQVFNCLGRWAVPVFVMISGALLLNSSKHEPLAHFYSKRVLKLVPLLLVWNAVYFRFMYWGDHLSIAQAWKIALYKGGFYVHLWYLPMALGLYLMTPLLRFSLGRAPRRILPPVLALFFLTLFVCSLAIEIPWGRLPTIALSVPFLGYYVLGHWLDTVRTGRSTGVLCVVLFLVAYASTVGGNCLWVDHTGFEHPFSPTVCAMAVSVFLLFRHWFSGTDSGGDQWLNRLGGAALGVYLVHPLVLHTIHRFSTCETRLPWLSIPLLTVAVFLISVVVTLSWARGKLLVRHTWIILKSEKTAPVVDGSVRNQYLPHRRRVE